MTQIVPRLLVRGLDRKQLIIAAAIAVSGVGAWHLTRGKPRTVEETTWDNVVFPEIAETPDADSETEPSAEMRVLDSLNGSGSGSGGMRVEMAANVPLHLDGQSQPTFVQEEQVREVSRLPEPTWLEGGIEAVDGTVY